MLEFQYEEPNLKPTFNDVPENGFFVNTLGALCQKVNKERFNTITNPDGVLYASGIYVTDNFEISRIIPDGIHF